MSGWPIPSNPSIKWKINSSLALVFVGTLSKIWLKCFNSFKCYNYEELYELINKRQPGRGLITVTNHDSCLDDPVVVGTIIPYKNLWNRTCRWSLGAKEICHSTKFTSWFFSLGKVMPVVRGDGIYQIAVNKAIDELNKGAWIHIFPEGRVNEQKENIRFKWGVARLVMEVDLTPIVLPFYTLGMDSVLPNKEPYRPKICNKVTTYVGKPIIFDELVKTLKEEKKSAKEIRIIITEKIQEEMQKLKKITETLHDSH